MKKLILVLIVISAVFISRAKKKPKPTGITGYEIVQKSDSLESREVTTFQVSCPVGKLVLSGGLNTYDEPTSLEVLSTYPTLDGRHWTVGVQNSGLTTIQVEVLAICADVAQ